MTTMRKKILWALAVGCLGSSLCASGVQAMGGGVRPPSSPPVVQQTPVNSTVSTNQSEPVKVEAYSPEGYLDAITAHLSKDKTKQEQAKASFKKAVSDFTRDNKSKGGQRCGGDGDGQALATGKLTKWGCLGKKGNKDLVKGFLKRARGNSRAHCLLAFLINPTNVEKEWHERSGTAENKMGDYQSLLDGCIAFVAAHRGEFRIPQS